MGGKDKISVIVPCYNVQKYVMRCFESIHNQTYGFENLEVIFVDDLSIDNTWSILELLQKKYPENVISVRMDKKGMCGGARNLGMDICSGKYITFVDADDWIHPEMIQQMWIKNGEYIYDIIQCDVSVSRKVIPKYENKCEKKEIIYKILDTDKRKKLILGWTGGYNVCVWAKLYYADFVKINNIRFQENRYFEDAYFSFMCILHAQSYCSIGEALYYYYQNSDGIVGSQKSNEGLNDASANNNEIIEEIRNGVVNKRILDDCYFEIQAAIFWKQYFGIMQRLDKIYEINKLYYRKQVQENDFFDGIMDNPYITNITDKEFLERIEYYKKGK